MATETSRYGINLPDKIPLNTQKNILLPVWAEDSNNAMLFAGWFVPQEAYVVSGSATINKGPDREINMPDGTTHTTPEYFNVVLDTEGPVSIRCVLTDGTTTLDVVQSFEVGAE